MAAKNGVLAGRYRLLHPARHDAVGTVWRAKDDLLDRYVTVKRLFPACPFDPAHSDRVRAKAIREARVALCGGRRSILGDARAMVASTISIAFTA